MSVDENTVHQITQELNRRKRELECARRISQALFQHQNVDDVVDQALGIALEVVHAQAGSVLLSNPETQELVFSYSIGARPPNRGTAFSWDQGIAGSVFQSGEAVVIEDAKQDIRHFPGIDDLTGFTTHDMITLPLKGWEGKAIGVLEVLNKRDGKLNSDDLGILTIISAFTALAIEQARLFEEAKRGEMAHILGDIGHDIKTFLMPVLSGAALLQGEVQGLLSTLSSLDVAKARQSLTFCNEVVETLLSNSRRIQDQVRELADGIRGLSTPLQLKRCQASAILNPVVEILRFLAEEKGLTLKCKELDHLPLIEGDERKLFIVFYNLVKYAITKTPEGGTITVSGSTDLQESSLHLEVTDTREGMPAEVQERLFTFGPGDRKIVEGGLGVKMIKEVIEAHGGHLTVESAVGVGTTFHIHLPLPPPIPSSS